ncbi:MAG: 3-alpha,7-alpha,12-alpha-trihydroxy-5-beta-cholest-24-enoyl-CoA hydratase [Rhodospirillaceae bacterium]|nr:3-alpha,7-alpha,12-alpha-trihydroxy-5-beta-cholest-24-enoyl-CoA hydratase [Rhodospirillaceae bacterium]
MTIDYDKAMASKLDGVEFTYGDRETMLYALSVGMGRDQLDETELAFTFEKDTLKTVPSMASVLSRMAVGRDVGQDRTKTVHGEQRLTLHRPIPPEGEIIADGKVIDVIDKGEGRGALIYTKVDARLKADGAPLYSIISTSFARGDGGFGGPDGAGLPLHVVPDRTPDASCALDIRKDQALLYRLNGDRNPLHADPQMAIRVGFPVPILHGLCTYGTACYAILKTMLDYDPDPVRGMDVRFSAPVLPGETITTNMWKDGPIISFECRVEERDVTVLKSGKMTLAH